MQNRTECNICGHKMFSVEYRFDTFNVLRCLECDTLCRDRIFDKDESKSLYAKDYFCDLQKDYFFRNIPLREKAFGHKIAFLDRLYPCKGKLLDLGCATGIFIKQAIAHGWDAEGVEFSEFAATYAHEKEGLNVRQGDLLDMRYPSDHFDAVTMWDMVDHSEYPQQVIAEAYRILKPGGIVALDTFMVDGLPFKLAESVYRCSGGLLKGPLRKGFPLHHSHYFSTETFANFLTMNGFVVIAKEGSYLDGEIVSLGFWGKRAVSFVNWMSDHVGKKMEMLIVGRKPERQK